MMAGCLWRSTGGGGTRRAPRSRSDARDARGGADLRRPAPRRAAAALRLPARARRRAGELGGAEGRPARARRAASRGARRGPPARIRRLRRRRSRQASTAPARSRSGTAAPTSCSRRRRTAASRVRLHGSASTASGRSCRRTLDGDAKNWLLLRKDGAHDGARADAIGRCSPPPSTALPRGDGWLFEVKWDGFRALGDRARRRGHARQPQRQRPDGRFRVRGSRAVEQARHARRMSCSTARSVRSTSRAGRASARSRREPARSSTTPSTCSRSTASRPRRRPLAERREALEPVARAVRTQCASRRCSTTGRRCSRPSTRAGARGRRRQARLLALPAGEDERESGSR